MKGRFLLHCVLGVQIHHARNPVSISDSTYDLLPNWQWHPLFRFRPGYTGWLFSGVQAKCHMFMNKSKGGSGKDVK